MIFLISFNIDKRCYWDACVIYTNLFRKDLMVSGNKAIFRLFCFVLFTTSAHRSINLCRILMNKNAMSQVQVKMRHQMNICKCLLPYFTTFSSPLDLSFVPPFPRPIHHSLISCLPFSPFRFIPIYSSSLLYPLFSSLLSIFLPSLAPPASLRFIPYSLPPFVPPRILSSLLSIFLLATSCLPSLSALFQYTPSS